MLQIRRRQEGIAYIPGIAYILTVELHIRDSVIRSQPFQGRRRCRGGIHLRHPLPLRCNSRTTSCTSSLRTSQEELKHGLPHC